MYLGRVYNKCLYSWPRITHPKGKFYDADDAKIKDIKLWQAIWACRVAHSTLK